MESASVDDTETSGQGGPAYLTTNDLSDLFGVTPSTIRDWVAAGEGPPCIQPGRQLLFPADGVAQWRQRLQDQRAERARRQAEPKPWFRSPKPEPAAHAGSGDAA